MTLASYVTKLHQSVRASVTEILPEKFGLVLDGWTCGSRHYVAIFAVYDDGSRPAPRDSNDDYFDDLDCSSRRDLL
jgi:hypothetical protein